MPILVLENTEQIPYGYRDITYEEATIPQNLRLI